MGATRKLQSEIDRVLKKVQEGVDVFDEIWNKVGIRRLQLFAVLCGRAGVLSCGYSFLSWTLFEARQLPSLRLTLVPSGHVVLSCAGRLLTCKRRLVCHSDGYAPEMTSSTHRRLQCCYKLRGPIPGRPAVHAAGAAAAMPWLLVELCRCTIRTT